MPNSFPPQTTGLGVAAKIVVPGTELPTSTTPGYNQVSLSLTSANGLLPTFQMVPLLEDVAGSVVGESAVTIKLGVAAPYALLAYSGITNTGSTSIVGGSIGSVPTASITGFNPPAATVDQADATAAQTALAAGIAYYQGLGTVSAITLSAAANAASSVTVYTGTVTGGDANAFAGRTYVVTGFSTSANNGTFLATASTATTLTLANTAGSAETHSGSAAFGGLSNL